MLILNDIHLLSGVPWPKQPKRHGYGIPVVIVIGLLALAAWTLVLGALWLLWWAI